MNHVVGRILNVCPTELIVLFGSFGRDEQNKNSDLDLIVVTPFSVQRKIVERQIKSSIQRYGIKSDIIIRSKDELEEELAQPGGFLRSVFFQGKIIYKKDE